MTEPVHEETFSSPRPRTEDELIEFIRARVSEQHDYNTSATALRDITLAAFNYAAGALGNSGFQASYAALDFYGKAMTIDGPFGVVQAKDMLYPQGDDPVGKARKWMSEWSGWAQDEAVRNLEEGMVKNLADGVGYPAHPRVWAHWLELAGFRIPRGCPTEADVQRMYDEQVAAWEAERIAEAGQA